MTHAMGSYYIDRRDRAILGGTLPRCTAVVRHSVLERPAFSFLQGRIWLRRGR